MLHHRKPAASRRLGDERAGRREPIGAPTRGPDKGRCADKPSAAGTQRKVVVSMLANRWLVVGLVALVAVIIVLVLVYSGGGSGGGGGGGY